MEKLSENAERIWKVLTHYSRGTIAKQVQRITSMRKTILYNGFKELESKGFVEHKKRLWIPKEKPSIEKPSEVELIREDLIKGKIKPSWNRLVSLADEKGLNPHPIALYNENMKKAEKATLGFMMVNLEEIKYQIKRNIIRYWLSKYA